MAWNLSRQLDSLSGILLPIAAVVVLAVAFFVQHRFFGNKCAFQLYDPDLDHFFSKREAPAYQSWIEILVILPLGGRAQRARSLLNAVGAAYRSFDVQGKRTLRPGRVMALHPTEGVLQTVPPRRWWQVTSRTQVLGGNEMSSLWHFPGSDEGVNVVARAGSVVLPPMSDNRGGGAHVGATTDADGGRQVIFYDDQLRRHQFYIARSGMGKSTCKRRS